jgi:enoyl-CoA hydratase/carnithine racemase
VADMGTLQRLPSIVGHGISAELALTARSFSGGSAGKPACCLLPQWVVWW